MVLCCSSVTVGAVAGLSEPRSPRPARAPPSQQSAWAPGESQADRDSKRVTSHGQARRRAAGSASDPMMIQVQLITPRLELEYIACGKFREKRDLDASSMVPRADSK